LKIAIDHAKPHKRVALQRSHHLLDKLVDQFFSVSESTESLSEGVSLDFETTEWGGELEWPEEVVGFLEFWSASGNLVDEVLHAGNSGATKLIGDDGVVGEGDSRVGDLTISSLVDKLGDGGSGWESVSDKWLNHSEHVPGTFVQLDEHTIVQLSQSKKLQDLLWLWGKLVDTSNSDNESNLSFSFNEERSSGLGISLSLNESLISSSVFLVVFLSISGSNFSSGSSIGLSLSSRVLECFKNSSIGFFAF